MSDDRNLVRVFVSAALGAVVAFLGVVFVAFAVKDDDAAEQGSQSAAAVTDSQETPPDASSAEGIPTEPNLKVAFIGDSGNGKGFRAVLQLIKSEGADMVVHNGDFDYDNDPDAFFSTIDDVLGPDFPYVGSVGNHDTEVWNEGCDNDDGCYAEFFKDRMQRAGITPDAPDLNDQMYSTKFKGLQLVFVGEDPNNTGDCSQDSPGYACYLSNQLSADDSIWKVCNWHKNQASMQIGEKDNEMGWGVYEVCKDAGAIIATAHEHSYSRTLTMTSMQDLEVDTSQHPTADGAHRNPGQLRVAPGSSFVFVSGLGGKGMRDQARCLPDEYPYGCNKEWASIYTTNQTSGEDERLGALFIEFHVDGDPNKARGYFKDTEGDVIDEFVVLAETGTPASQPSLSDTVVEEIAAQSGSTNLDTGSQLDIEGTVTDVRDGVVTIRTEDGRHFDVSMSLKPDDFVEVEGTNSNGTLSAFELELADRAGPRYKVEDGVTQITGRLVSISNGVAVVNVGEELFEAELAFRVGDFVEVEGAMKDGFVLALELERGD
jgi:hypothetical protein